jgi:hypothetical protein
MAKQTRAGGARLEVVQSDRNGPKAIAAHGRGDRASAAEQPSARRKTTTKFYDSELARL